MSAFDPNAAFALTRIWIGTIVWGVRSPQMCKDELRATIGEPWVLLALGSHLIVLLLPLTAIGD